MRARFLLVIFSLVFGSVCSSEPTGVIDASANSDVGRWTDNGRNQGGPGTMAKDKGKVVLGKEQKFRILVDKVMQPSEGWVTKEWMVKEAAGAGFNVFVPRIGHDRYDEVRRVAGWCKKYGIYMMPWMRGTLTAPSGPSAAGKRLVWADGTEQLLYSPSSDELWAWMSQHIIEYAKIAADDPTLIGVFLDYENYAKNKRGNGYPLSYDMNILKQFANAKSITLPEARMPDRKKFLEEQQLHAAFYDFSVIHWRQRTKALRQAVDKYDKGFRFVVYPPRTLFIEEAVYEEWGNDDAPLVLADYMTYGRFYGRFEGNMIFHSEALQSNREALTELVKIPQQAGTSHFYIGGIDPATKGADPEFSAKNAVMISEITDGYWVFYEGPTYNTTHLDYFKWFSWANNAIVKKDYAKQHEPRITPEPWLEGLVGDDGKPVIVPPTSKEAIVYPSPSPKIRRRGNIVVAGQKGKTAVAEISHHSVGGYKCLLTWNATSVAGDKLGSGIIAQGKSGAISVTPKIDGLFLLQINVNSCAFSITGSNSPLAVYTNPDYLRNRGLSLYQGPVQFYFEVPKGGGQVSFKASGEGSETVRVELLDQTGKVLDQAETTTAQTTVEVKANANATNAAGQIWSIVAKEASQGVFEDYKLSPGAMLPPVLSFLPR